MAKKADENKFIAELFPDGVANGHDASGYIATCNKTKAVGRSSFEEGYDVALERLADSLTIDTNDEG